MIKEKDKKIAYFHLPGLFEFSYIYKNFLNMYVNEREKFNSWVAIECLYGNPTECLWGGGRRKSIDVNELEVHRIMTEYNIKSAFTFSNLLIEEKHTSDYFCNYLCKLFDNGQNYIIVNSPVLEEYILKNYPNYQLISSTTKCIRNIDKISIELENDNYSLICLDYNFNNDYRFLEQLNHKDKCELLVNPVCIGNCSRRKEHYECISKRYLHEPVEDFECEYQFMPFYKAQQNPLFIGKEAIYKTYLPMGYNHFKIEGRCAQDDDLIEILLYYLIKPEYQIEIRERLYGL